MTIVSSWGGGTSNSYISYTDAASFIENGGVYDYTKWTEATTVQCEAALIQATREIDAFQYIGERYYAEQELEFPVAIPGNIWPHNYVVSDDGGLDIEQARMKRAVERATCIQTVWIIRSDGVHVHAENQEMGIASYSETTGPVSESVAYRSGGGALRKLHPDAKSLLSPYRTGRRIYRK